MTRRKRRLRDTQTMSSERPNDDDDYDDDDDDYDRVKEVALSLREIKCEIDIDKRIDLNHLEDEWRDLPSLVEKWYDRLAIVTANKEKLENEKDILRSQYLIEFHEEWENYFDLPKKPTESMIAAKIIDQADYQDLCILILEENRKLNAIKAAIKAISYKKTALGNEVSLWIAKYWSEPKIDKQIRDARQSEDDRIKDSIRTKSRDMRRRKTKK